MTEILTLECGHREPMASGTYEPVSWYCSKCRTGKMVTGREPFVYQALGDLIVHDVPEDETPFGPGFSNQYDEIEDDAH